MADVPAGKLFQTGGRGPLRLVWNLMNFHRAEALFARQSLEIAKRFGKPGLEALIRNLKRNVRRAEILLEYWEKQSWDTKPPQKNEDLVTLVLTLRPEGSQAGFAYWSHVDSRLIEEEMQGVEALSVTPVVTRKEAAAHVQATDKVVEEFGTEIDLSTEEDGYW